MQPLLKNLYWYLHIILYESIELSVIREFDENQLEM